MIVVFWNLSQTETKKWMNKSNDNKKIKTKTIQTNKPAMEMIYPARNANATDTHSAAPPAPKRRVAIQWKSCFDILCFNL